MSISVPAVRRIGKASRVLKNSQKAMFLFPTRPPSIDDVVDMLKSWPGLEVVVEVRSVLEA